MFGRTRTKIEIKFTLIRRASIFAYLQRHLACYPLRVRALYSSGWGGGQTYPHTHRQTDRQTASHTDNQSHAADRLSQEQAYGHVTHLTGLAKTILQGAVAELWWEATHWQATKLVGGRHWTTKPFPETQALTKYRNRWSRLVDTHHEGVPTTPTRGEQCKQIQGNECMYRLFLAILVYIQGNVIDISRGRHKGLFSACANCHSNSGRGR